MRRLIIQLLGVSTKRQVRWDEAREEGFGYCRNDQRLLLFISVIDPKKLDLLIPAARDLLVELGEIHFVLAGQIPQDPKYDSRFTNKLKLQT
jgi:glycosyltransferase involved in cell wall biosynthesis